MAARRAAAAGALPADLADLLLVRLDQLDDDARTVVRARGGRRPPGAARLLAAVAGLDETGSTTALRAAVDANVLVAGEQRRLRVPPRAAARGGLRRPAARASGCALHARYAAALEPESSQGTAAELARHARAARDVPTAIRASIQAGDEAMTVGGPERQPATTRSP